MNQKLRIASIFFLILLVASCTNRRYSHLTGFQFKSGKQSKKVLAIDDKQTKSDEVVEVFQSEEIKQTIASEVLQSSKEQLSNTTYSEKLIQKDLIDGKISENSKQKTLGTPKLLLAPVKKAKKIAKRVTQLKSENISADSTSEKEISNLIYWILVVVLILLILTLLKEILGALYFPFILIVLIILIGHLLGLW